MRILVLDGLFQTPPVGVAGDDGLGGGVGVGGDHRDVVGLGRVGVFDQHDRDWGAVLAGHHRQVMVAKRSVSVVP